MKYFILLMMILLTACTKTIPLVQCPAPIIPEQPHYPIADLHENSNASDVMKAWVVSFAVCKKHDAILTKQLEGYK